MAKSIMSLFDKGLISKKNLHRRLVKESKRWKVLKALKQPLHLHLGFTTSKAYNMWMANPNNLNKIIRDRKNKT